jgi:hypothetical protein
MPISAVGRERRARIAAIRRHHPDRPELVVDDQRALKVDVLEQHLRALVNTFPPLTAEQRTRLALLLHGPAAEGGGGDAA